MFVEIIIISFLPATLQAVRPSSGCGREMPGPPNPGHKHKFEINYHDRFLGPTPRQYHIQLPNGLILQE